MGRPGFLSESDAFQKLKKELPQQAAQQRDLMKTDNEKKAAKDKIPGGLADNAPDSGFAAKDLRKGQKVEREHTSDPELAKEIAKDHLTEDPAYYDKLQKMEKE
jgi:hypothetical protein